MKAEHKNRRALWSWASRSVALFLAASVVPRGALADTGFTRVGGDLEGFITKNVDSTDRSAFGPGLGGALYGELNANEYLGLHGGAIGMYFFERHSDKPTSWFGFALGPRLHWGALLDLKHDGWVDLHYNQGKSQAK